MDFCNEKKSNIIGKLQITKNVNAIGCRNFNQVNFLPKNTSPTKYRLLKLRSSLEL